MSAVAFARRMYAGGAPSTTVPGGIGLTDASSTLTSGSNWPNGGSGMFYVVADLGLSTEEKMRCTSTSGTLLTYDPAGGRGADGTAAAVHQPGCTIKVCHVAQDDDEANHMVNILGNASVGAIFVGGGTATVPQTLNVLAEGSLLYGKTAANPAALAIGAQNTVLTSNGTDPTWAAPVLTNSGWLTVGGTGVAFKNSWGNSDAALVGYIKVGTTVRLRGAINGGSAGTAAFTLPAGYIPSQSMIFPVRTNTVLTGILPSGTWADGYVYVDTSGNVTIATNPVNFLDSISFDVT